jgi:hypothetical protein
VKITVTFEPTPGVAISAVYDSPDYNCRRDSPLPGGKLMGEFRALSDECLDKAMELGFTK